MRILLQCNHKTSNAQGGWNGTVSPLWEQMCGGCHQGEDFHSLTLKTTANERSLITVQVVRPVRALSWTHCVNREDAAAKT